MSGPLESSITLEEVFAVVIGKRVPLAPELAGYLVLEITEGSGGFAGDIDPSQVYIGDEGSVALVRPKTSPGGDPETSIRAILQKLLDASGSSTPALGNVAKRAPSGGGIAILAQELEAALIPVNRAAGRRALARLAREVKRVTLGVGRNASVPASERGPRASVSSLAAQASSPNTGSQANLRSAERAPEVPAAPAPAVAGPGPAEPPSSQPAFEPEELPTTARRDLPADVLARETDRLVQSTRNNEANELPTMVVLEQPVMRDEVDSLLSSFEVSESRADIAVSQDLKAMVGLDPTPAPPTHQMAQPKGESGGLPPASSRSSEPLDSGIDHLLALSGGSSEGRVRSTSEAHIDTRSEGRKSKRMSAAEATGSAGSHRSTSGAGAGAGPAPKPWSIDPTAPPEERKSNPSYADERQLPTAPSSRRTDLASSSSRRRQGGIRADQVLVTVLVLLLGGGGVLFWFLKPGFLSGRTDDKVQAEHSAYEAEKKRIAATELAQACKASLTVTDVPVNAEVLLRVGQAPVDIDHMPVGARLEFVATTRYVAKRAMIPAAATWDPGPDGKPRFEVAVQLEPQKPKPKTVDLWPPGEPGSEVGGKGDPGTVHIVSSPRGAEVWLLTGLGPEAVMDQLPCDRDVDILVAGPTVYRKRLHAKGSDFVAGATATTRVAKVSAR